MAKRAWKNGSAQTRKTPDKLKVVTTHAVCDSRTVEVLLMAALAGTSPQTAASTQALTGQVPWWTSLAWG